MEGYRASQHEPKRFDNNSVSILTWHTIIGGINVGFCQLHPAPKITVFTNSPQATYSQVTTMGSVDGTFFDRLPAQCLELIVRLAYSHEIKVTGDICSDTSAESLDTHHEMSLLFSEKSPFCSVVSEIFTSLSIEADEDGSFLDFADGYILISPGYGPELNSELVKQVFSNCGRSIKSIVFGTLFADNDDEEEEEEYDENAKIKFGLETALLVLQYCGNAEELLFFTSERCAAIYVIKKVIFYTFASQVQSLAESTQFSDNLLDLRLCTSIKSFSSYLFNKPTYLLIDALPSVGRTLESLTLSVEFNENNCMRLLNAIQKHCRRLHTVRFSGCLPDIIRYAGEQRYTELLCSYGHQLIEAIVDELGDEALQRVIEACPRLEIPSYGIEFEDAHPPKRLSLIGPRITYLCFPETWRYTENWLHPLRECINLRVLTARDEAVLMAIPLLFALESLVLTATDLSSNVVSCVASKTSNLKLLSWTTTSRIGNGTMFEKIMQSNQSLRHVSIYECGAGVGHKRKRGPTESTLVILQQLLTTFLSCRRLTLKLQGTEDHDVTGRNLRDVCGVLPCRGIHVNIQLGSDISYVQTGEPL